MNQPNDIDEGLVKKLAGLLDETRLTEIEYAWGEFRLRVTRQAAPVQAVAAAAPVAPAPVAESAPSVADPSTHPGAIKSPMVGTVYLSPQPGTPPFVRIGDLVSAGQTLLIIEAMKVMNQIRAPKPGKVTQILVDDTGPVEFAQTVMVVE